MRIKFINIYQTDIFSLNFKQYIHYKFFFLSIKHYQMAQSMYAQSNNTLRDRVVYFFWTVL